MKIYHYHPEYKYPIAEGIADLSPLDLPNEVWLIPAHATSIELPSFDEGTIPVFFGDCWKIVEDKRGIYYNIETAEEIVNKDPINTPLNSTTQIPPEVPSTHELTWNNGWVLNEKPLPPQPKPVQDPIIDLPANEVVPVDPMEGLTPIEKLNAIGLTVDDLKVLLGI